MEKTMDMTNRPMTARQKAGILWWAAETASQSLFTTQGQVFFGQQVPDVSPEDASEWLWSRVQRQESAAMAEYYFSAEYLQDDDADPGVD